MALLIVVLLALFTAELVSAIDDGEFLTRFGVYGLFLSAILLTWFVTSVS